jgi:hypothetical protein
MKLCTYCQQPLPRHTNQCNCKEAEAERSKQWFEKELEKFNKAEKISLEEALKKYVFLYIDNLDKYVETDNFEHELEELLGDINEEVDKEEQLKKEVLRIYVTKETKLSLDAPSIVENSVDDLHEEAYDRIGDEKLDELQELLNSWAQTVKDDTLSYYPDYNIAVKL